MNIFQYSCSTCGADKFTLFHTQEGKIIAACVNCEGRTEICGGAAQLYVTVQGGIESEESPWNKIETKATKAWRKKKAAP